MHLWIWILYKEKVFSCEHYSRNFYKQYHYHRLCQLAANCVVGERETFSLLILAANEIFPGWLYLVAWCEHTNTDTKTPELIGDAGHKLVNDQKKIIKTNNNKRKELVCVANWLTVIHLVVFSCFWSQCEWFLQTKTGLRLWWEKKFFCCFCVFMTLHTQLLTPLSLWISLIKFYVFLYVCYLYGVLNMSISLLILVGWLLGVILYEHINASTETPEIYGHYIWLWNGSVEKENIPIVGHENRPQVCGRSSYTDLQWKSFCWLWKPS